MRSFGLHAVAVVISDKLSQRHTGGAIGLAKRDSRDVKFVCKGNVAIDA